MELAGAGVTPAAENARKRLIALLKRAPSTKRLSPEAIERWVDANVEIADDGTVRNKLMAPTPR